MKKLFILATLLFTGITLTACGAKVTPDVLTTQEALGAMTYMSASFLDENTATPTGLSNGITRLITTPTTQIETELDEVNIYVDKLKSFIEGGATGFGSIVEATSDNAEYAYMISINVDTDVYVLYYNVDAVTNAITGLFILDGVEYTIVVDNDLPDAAEFGDDEVDADEPAEIDDELEYSMVLVATDPLTENTIIITYEVEIETSEIEKSFTIEKSIGDSEDVLEIQIEDEDGELSVEISHNDNLYEFTMEVEDDGQTVYVLEYSVNGVTGSVRITETIDAVTGDLVYNYQITEGDTQVDVDLAEPDSDDDDVPVVEDPDAV